MRRNPTHATSSGGMPIPPRYTLSPTGASLALVGRDATRETLELTPLPCRQHLTPEKRQHLAAAMVSEIDGEAADRRKHTGVQPLGPAAILAQSPESRSLKTKRSPAPAVHAASRAVRRELRNAYFLFVAAYRNAAEKLRAGQRDAPFLMRWFPPA